MSGHEMLYMTTMESISSILAYCSPNLEDQEIHSHIHIIILATQIMNMLM